MRALPLLVALLALNPIATGAVRTDPPQPFYEGDFVRIEIDVSHAAQSYAEPDMLVENLDNHRVNWKSGPQGPKTLEISGWATRSGEISFVSSRYQDAEGNLRDLPGMSFPVLPLPTGRDLGESFRDLERIGRSSVVMATVLADDRPIYPGSRTAVEWWATTAAGVNLNMTLPIRSSRDARNLSIEGAADMRIFETRLQKLEASGGVLIRKQRIATYYFQPERAGSYQIPPLPFEGDDPRLRDQRGYARMFTRMAPPLTIEVLPLPEEAAGRAIGTFTMECAAANIPGYWPAVSVRIKGNGTPGGSPRFVSAPAIPVIMVPGEPRVDTYNGEQSRGWILRVQKREKEMKLPEVVYSYYDDEKRSMAELKCAPPPVSYRDRTASEPSAAGVLPEVEAGGWLSIAELALVVILALGLFLLRHAFRP